MNTNALKSTDGLKHSRRTFLKVSAGALGGLTLVPVYAAESPPIGKVSPSIAAGDFRYPTSFRIHQLRRVPGVTGTGSVKM